MFYVYGLRLKGDSEYRYIGCTSEPDVRLMAHLSYDNKGSDKYTWLRENKDAVEMVTLATVEDRYDASVIEANQIAKHRRAGHRLFNFHARGITQAMSDETKAKLSAPKKRRMTKAQREAALRKWFE
jgi:predicted GIY-YIG superfamily endonuclease